MPGTTPIARHRTALRRVDYSRPVRLAIQQGLLKPQISFFDYGCGQGDDVRQLQNAGIDAIGWDPFFSPSVHRPASDVVNLGYVVNVVEDMAERVRVLQEAWALTNRLLIVSARLTNEAASDGHFPCSDGYLTRRGTFQKLFEQQELRSWIDSVLDEPSVAAAPGIFYVFRDPDLKYQYVSARLRGSRTWPRAEHSTRVFEAYRSLLDELIDFVLARGRLPIQPELPHGEQLCRELGSIRRAFAVVRRVTGAGQWDQIRAERAQDLLVYLALARFSRRPNFSALPLSLRLDLRTFFSSYKRACVEGDTLLFSAGNPTNIEHACRKSTLGKLTPSALYVHESALANLAPILRVYEGCARALTGMVEGSNIIKLHFAEPMVSYLSYPQFESDPHPSLTSSLTVHLQTFHIRQRQYHQVENPPILHRKEAFLNDNHPMRAKYERLTRQEEKKGLYEQPSLIGTCQAWRQLLNSKKLRTAGHRLLRVAQ
jgi:DNA phosphorothioation-associated putative methyltransferase